MPHHGNMILEVILSLGIICRLNAKCLIFQVNILSKTKLWNMSQSLPAEICLFPLVVRMNNKLTYKQTLVHNPTTGMSLSTDRRCWSLKWLSVIILHFSLFWRIIMVLLQWFFFHFCCQGHSELTSKCDDTYWRPLCVLYFVFRLYSGDFVAVHHIIFFKWPLQICFNIYNCVRKVY